MELIIILTDIILPIFIIMSVGYIIQKKLHLNIQTLARLNIYFLIPAFIFEKLYSTQFSLKIFLYVLVFFVIYVAILYMIGNFIGKAMKLEKGKRTTFTNSALFFNSGNYGVPVNDLVFRSDPFAMSIQVIVLTLQNIFLFSYGIISMQAADTGKLKALLDYFKLPILYAMVLGIGLNVLGVTLPTFIEVPANYAANAMIALALFTLGAQVAEIRLTSGLSNVYGSLFVRLMLGPVIALGIIYLLRIDGVFAQALFIASAMPTSVNSAVIAEEYKNHPDFAAQIVLFSTIFSAITVTVVIYISRILFG